MSKDKKSIDIRLYSVSKVKRTFDEAANDDAQPAADVIDACRSEIEQALARGKSLQWIISVLQRGGMDLGTRQLHTYLQRAGITRETKRLARGGGLVKASRRGAGRQPAPQQTDALQPAPVSGGAEPEEAMKHAEGQASQSFAENHAAGVQSIRTGNEAKPAALMNPREVQAGGEPAEEKDDGLQEAGGSGGKLAFGFGFGQDNASAQDDNPL